MSDKFSLNSMVQACASGCDKLLSWLNQSFPSLFDEAQRPSERLKTWGWAAGGIGGGLLMGLAPVNAWPLAWVAMVPLWLGLGQWEPLSPEHSASERLDKDRSQPGRRRLLLGAVLWGLAYHGTALSWITGLHPLTWMGVPWLGSVAIALFAWVFITLWGVGIVLSWTGLMVLITRWKLRSGVPLTGTARVLLGTALWCAVEWVWSQGPLYWTSLSYTQSPHNLLVLQLGQLSGPITVTAAIVAVNGLLAEFVRGVVFQFRQVWGVGRGDCLRRQTPRANDCAQPPGVGSGDFDCAQPPGVGSGGFDCAQPPGVGEDNFVGRERRFFTGGIRRVGGTAIALFLGLHLLGLGLYAWPLADKADEQLAVGLVQGNVPTAQKLTGEGVQSSRQIYLDGYESLVAQGAQLVITPEGAIPQFWNAFLQSRNPLQRAVVKRGVPLVLGTFVHAEISNSKSPITQSLLTLTPSEKIAGRYNKVKLVPLGEYIPFENVLGSLVSRLSPFGESMVAGGFDQSLGTPFGPMAAGICYESAFAELFRQQVERGGQAILTASNNDPYPPRQMMQHHAQDVMRAVETNRWEVRVTNTGISGVVDPKGRSHWISAPNESVTHIGQIYRRHTRTPYVRWGDWLTPLLLVISVAIIRR
ncbi:MAG: apolipoprotein N-acyltransferase [Cyanobacteria bacterium J06598_3]